MASILIHHKNQPLSRLEAATIHIISSFYQIRLKSENFFSIRPDLLEEGIIYYLQ